MRNVSSRTFLALCVLNTLGAVSVFANDRYIVRVSGGSPAINALCSLLGCDVVRGLEDPAGQLFLVTDTSATFLSTVLNQSGVIDAEADLIATIANSYTTPAALYESAPVNYYGTTVRYGYVYQPASQIIRLAQTQTGFHVKGVGIVAVIDTGIDPNHPVFRHILVPGYDFTRNEDGEGDETVDVVFTTTPSADVSPAYWTSPNSTALVTQSTAAVVDGNPNYDDFGHGTMVAGVIHLVAPGALLMPLKAFGANGSGYTSDIIRATYWAVTHNANIINMSFNLAAYSLEMKNAIDFAMLKGLICVASAGNSGRDVAVYPASYRNVIGVASTTNADQRSTFSNYGTPPVWVAAPGEGIVTTYPFGTYAAGWGTSFSTPFVSGVADLMLDYGGSILTAILVSQNQSDCAQSVAHAKTISPPLGHGRLDTYNAVAAWRQMLGK